MNLKVNRGIAAHLVMAIEYYDKHIGMTEPMRYVLSDLQEIIRFYDNRWS